MEEKKEQESSKSILDIKAKDPSELIKEGFSDIGGAFHGVVKGFVGVAKTINGIGFGVYEMASGKKQ
jgi:hypothetical protein